MTAPAVERAIGASPARLEARAKVTGEARYAYEYEADGIAYCVPVQSAIARGTVREVPALPGVLAALWAGNAPELGDSGDPELRILQSREVAYRGQIVAAVVAESLEAAREAAGRLEVTYDEQEHDVVLEPGHPKLYTPEVVNPRFPAVSEIGDFEGAFASAPVTHDGTYTTPAFHNNPMEPHATLAMWDGDGSLTVYDSNQGASAVQNTLSKMFGLEPAQVRVISPHVGGGFGSKGLPRPPCVLAALAAKVVGRPVKVATTRQQMFS